jgi:hypothetical protein
MLLYKELFSENYITHYNREEEMEEVIKIYNNIVFI